MVESELTELKDNGSHSLDIKVLPLLPLKNVVILPKSITPIIVGRQSSILAVEDSLKGSEELFITAQKNSEIEHPSLQDIFHFGTRGKILQVMRMHKGSLKILVEGIIRSKIVKRIDNPEFILVECQDIKTSGLDNHSDLEAAWRQLISLYTKYAQLNPKAPSDLISQVKSYEDMDNISDSIAVQINLSFDERQKILELSNLVDRIIKLCALLHKEIDILETEERIKGNIQKQVEKNQREYYLNEQIKAIHKELGREDSHAEILQLRNKIKTLGLPKEPMEKIEKELKRLEQMPPMSSEAVVSRHYIDWLISLPWKKESRDTVSLKEAEDILNHNHSGLKKVKERIIEFLAAKKFSKKFSKSPIICLIGPPGVGKTSLAQSIADSLGREFVRISLGGVKDEAEIRGHRRTYIGALPGKIIQAMRKAKTLNPVILLDEIDKMSSDFHGDPSAALLEVLDPEQNRSFVDHFLEVEYNLSKVMFIATANHIEGIPYPLFDRMERIQLSGYTDQEKLSITKDFLIPKNLQEYGLKPEQFQLDDSIIKKIIHDYTKEAGVRQLERIISKLMRKAIQLILKSDSTASIEPIIVDEKLLKEWLGNPIFKRSNINKSNRVGIATGLAWTEFGGDVLEIEVSILPGKGAMTLTGQLGDVMQESAHAALSYIRARAKKLGLKENFYSSKDIHIHVPEGATPKDGPSAGITICTALVSALTNNPLKPLTAMTGEVTLSGRVLAIGGLKEKLLAAYLYGINNVIIPEENRDDFNDIMKDISLDGKMDINFVYLIVKFCFTY
jgi:ATP-dependent Lon protease